MALSQTDRQWAIGMLMAASLIGALPLAWLLNIRFDEAFTLQTTLGGPLDAAKQAIGFGQQAPLYFVLISIWRMADDSIFFARLFSVICFPLIIWTAAEASRRYVPGVSPFWAALIVFVHQQVVWNALDIRLYALMTLLSGLLLVLFHDAYLAEDRKTSFRILFIAAAVASLYTQYYLGFMLAGGAFALMITGRWRSLGDYLVDMVITGTLFVPMALTLAGGQLSTVAGHSEASIEVGALINGTYQRSLALMIAVNAIEAESFKRWLARLVTVGIAGLFLIKLVRERSREDMALGAFTLVSLGFFVLAFHLVGFSLTQQRHFSSIIIPLTLIPLSAFAQFRSRRLLLAWIALVVGLSVLFLFNNYRSLAKPGDFERVANYIENNEQPNQPILIFHADAILPFRYYYEGQNKLVALPQENGTTAWNPRNNILKDAASVLDRINSETYGSEQFWLAHDGWCAQDDIKFNCGTLEKVINENFVVVSTESFLPPTTVRLLRRK